MTHSGSASSGIGVTPGSARAKVLERLGLTEEQARTYLALLDSPRTVEAVAQELEAETESVARSVNGLLEAGMLVRLPGRGVRYRSVPPDEALRPLIAEHEQQLEESRQTVEELARASRVSSGDLIGEDYVEVVVGKERVVSQADRYWIRAADEVLALVKGPVLDPVNAPARAGLRSGVAHRSVWDRTWIEQPGMFAVAREWVELGEEIRISSVVPAKLVIFDRTTAVFNVTETLLGEPVIAGFATRHPEVVETLVLHFEMMWRQAVPAFDMSETEASAEAEATTNLLIQCLAAGMKDVAIARELGVSKRTLSRRVNDLLSELGVSTRFQAGLRLGEQPIRRDGRPRS